MCALPRALLLAALAAVLLACASPEAEPEDDFRVLDRAEVPLDPAPALSPGQPFSRSFEQLNTRGSISDSGEWIIEQVVKHTRLRCGTYQVGVQLGRGEAACAQPVWLGEPQYGTQERHCNSAPRIHTGGGTLPVTREQVSSASCVRVWVRCSGACG